MTLAILRRLRRGDELIILERPCGTFRWQRHFLLFFFYVVYRNDGSNLRTSSEMSVSRMGRLRFGRRDALEVNTTYASCGEDCDVVLRGLGGAHDVFFGGGEIGRWYHQEEAFEGPDTGPVVYLDG
jgi:hypothetical protein